MGVTKGPERNETVRVDRMPHEHDVQTRRRDHRDYQVLMVLSVLVLTATGVLLVTEDTSFEPFFGAVNPLVGVSATLLLGGFLLRFLSQRGFAIYSRSESRKGIKLAAKMATLFAVPVILVDVLVGFPRDMNVLLPRSLLFYPAIGLVAEIVFHLLPLALLVILFGRHIDDRLWSKAILASIVIVSSVEAVFQVAFGGTGGALSFLGMYVGLHLFGFGLLQLYVYRRYDFVSMYAFRIFYYVYWHILWGTIRLELLY